MYFVLGQTLKLVQGAGRSLSELAAFGICGATCLCSEGELAAKLQADFPLLGLQAQGEFAAKLQASRF